MRSFFAVVFFIAGTAAALAEPITIGIASAVGFNLVAGSATAAVATFGLTVAASTAVAGRVRALRRRTVRHDGD